MKWIIKYLDYTIVENYNGGPVGISTLATSLSENTETIEEVYEPFLNSTRVL